MRTRKAVTAHWPLGSVDVTNDGVTDDHSSFTWRGVKRFQLEISKTGGRGGEVLVRGLARAFRCWSTHGPWCVPVGVKETWDDRVLGAQALWRERHRVEEVGVITLLTTDLWTSAHDVSSADHRSLSSACFSSRSWICFSSASSSNCIMCSSNVSSSALKGRHTSDTFAIRTDEP